MEVDFSYYENYIVSRLRLYLDHAGLFYRVFSRSKSVYSIKKKIEKKKNKYSVNGSKMQDLIGIRIVFYFIDDVSIFADFLRKKDFYVDESNSERELAHLNIQNIDLSNTVFMPTRLNLICKIPESLVNDLQQELHVVTDFDSNLIDMTYEIQLRSVLSEGWHEVEHDLRYKCKDEDWWDYCKEESRFLNGIFATLETSERSMKELFSNIAYKNYKHKDWAAMLRNHLCLRFIDSDLDDWVVDMFNIDEDIAKAYYRFDRSALIKVLCQSPIILKLKMMHVVFLINRMANISDEITAKENLVMKEMLDKLMNINNKHYDNSVK